MDDSLRRSVSHTELLDASDPIKMESKYPTRVVFLGRVALWFLALRSLRRPSGFCGHVLIVCEYLTGHFKSQRPYLSVHIQVWVFFAVASAKEKTDSRLFSDTWEVLSCVNRFK